MLVGAARQGHALAVAHLASLYAKGDDGARQSDVPALMYVEVALANLEPDSKGRRKALKLRDRLLKGMDGPNNVSKTPESE